MCRLNVTRCHIIRNCIAENIIIGELFRDIRPSLADDNRKFPFIIEAIPSHHHESASLVHPLQ